MSDDARLAELEARLNDFDPAIRRRALDELLRLQPNPPVAASDVANMHCHTFFSFNAYGYSPTALAWLGRQRGYKLMGTVDFDVLDAVDEFLGACELTGVRGSAGIETRVFLPEFDQHEMNSPGEPGVLYHMGIGFTSGNVPAEAQTILDELREQSRERNLGLIERVNAHLDPVRVDYAQDVLPLTPKGTATERHIVVAYINVAQRVYPDEEEQARFWGNRLDMPSGALAQQMHDVAGFQNLIRSKLMKQGGVGYVQPGHDTFPPIDRLNAMILACGALPCAAWLDGTTSGEQRMDDLLVLLIDKDAAALNIVPDRNWDIDDRVLRDEKLSNLYAVVNMALDLDLPLNIGTEMNSFGQKLVDEFDAPALAPVRQPFIDGAYFIYGHTIMQCALGMGYQSAWAKATMSTRRARNAFYTRVGRSVPPGPAGRAKLDGLGPEMAPVDIVERLDK